MNKQEAKELVRTAVRALCDAHVERLMEHAGAKTPIILNGKIHNTWVDLKAGSG